jgi:hypothetical protein
LYQLRTTKKIEIMRNLFEPGKMTEVRLYSENKSVVRITMQKNKCFEIRQLNPSFYWELCYETSSTCEWSEALRLAITLIK